MSKPTLMPFQRAGVRWLLRAKGRGLLADEMGLGKTVQAARYLMRSGTVSRPALVVCPASLKPQWAAELRKWAGVRAVVINGAPGRRRRPWGKRGVAVVNYDVLGAWAERMKNAFACVVLDECHYAKNPQTHRTKAVRAICQHVPQVIAMSGTPIVNRPAEFYTTLKLLAPRTFPSFWRFAQRYCGLRHTRWGWKWTGATHLPELRRRLKPLMLRRLKADVLPELPEKRRCTVRMDYDRRAYARAMEAARDLPEDALLDSVRRGAALAKLESCVEWAREHAAASQRKLVLFAEHHAVLDALVGGLGGAGGLCAGPVDGRMEMAQRTAEVQRFMRDRSTRAICGHTRVLGVGWTLTAADAVAFIELPWTPGDLVQAEDRIHRIGQRSSAVVIYYLVGGAFDAELARLLLGKRVVMARLLDKGRAGDVRKLDVRRELAKIIEQGE